MNNQPKIDVGIVVNNEIKFSLSSDFLSDNKEEIPMGAYSAQVINNKICITNQTKEYIKAESVILTPTGNNSFFELKDVVIGVDFHWEQKENQQFRGALKFIMEDKQVRAINLVDLEDYLKSVISSEMSSTSSPDLLKAHAVISRSWLLAQIEKSRSLEKSEEVYVTSTETEDEIIRWYDREDHDTFDVCADDHCQRYQGITKIHSQKAIEAIEETFGEVLFSENKICDARFSKCCGGISENFESPKLTVKSVTLELFAQP
jgi:stage II sporulation protein D